MYTLCPDSAEIYRNSFSFTLNAKFNYEPIRPEMYPWRSSGPMLWVNMRTVDKLWQRHGRWTFDKSFRRLCFKGLAVILNIYRIISLLNRMDCYWTIEQSPFFLIFAFCMLSMIQLILS